MPPTGVSISTCLSSPFCSFFTFTLQAGRSSVPRVRSEAHIRHVGAFAHVNAADGRVDIDLFVFSILLFFYVHAAGWQKQRAPGQIGGPHPPRWLLCSRECRRRACRYRPVCLLHSALFLRSRCRLAEEACPGSDRRPTSATLAPLLT